MTSILDRLFRRCAHQFSWPRKASDGTYYQVCLSCGAQYAYDWEAMRRTGRIEAQPAHLDPSRPARRMNVAIPVQYREVGSDIWQHATTENISQTGVKIEGVSGLKENAAIEMVFDMPEPLSGQPGAKVGARAQVVRVVESSRKERAPAFAATLRDFRYLSEKPARQEEEEQAVLSLQTS